MADKQFFLFCSGLEQYNFQNQHGIADILLFFARAKRNVKHRQLTILQSLAELLQLRSGNERDLPVGAMQSALLDDQLSSQYLWFARLDPVAVIPNRDHLLLLGNASFELNDDESAQIVQGLNEFLKDEGIFIIALTSMQWIVCSKRTFELSTTEPEKAFGQDIKRVMPVGDGAGYWQKITNEIQMWLHTCEVNSRHMAVGRQTVNSVWLWGAGTRSDIGKYEDRVCFIDEVNSVVHGLAVTSGKPFVDVNQELSILDRCIGSDADTYIAALDIDSLHRMDQLNGLISIAISRLKSGQLDRVVIDTGLYEFVLNRWSMRRFWRSIKNLELHFR